MTINSRLSNTIFKPVPTNDTSSPYFCAVIIKAA